VIAARELAESAVVRRAPAAVAVFRMGQDEMEVPVFADDRSGMSVMVPVEPERDSAGEKLRATSGLRHSTQADEKRGQAPDGERLHDTTARRALRTRVGCQRRAGGSATDCDSPSPSARTAVGRRRLARIARERAKTRQRYGGRFVGKNGPPPPLDFSPEGLAELARTRPTRFAKLLLRLLR
jgi:hypothetical protein